MSLIKRSVVLHKEQTKGVFTIIRLGDTVGAKIALNDPIKGTLWAGVKVGDEPQQNFELDKQITELNINCSICFNDSIGVVIIDGSGNPYAYGGVRETVSVNQIKDAMNNIAIEAPAEEAPEVSKPAEEAPEVLKPAEPQKDEPEIIAFDEPATVIRAETVQEKPAYADSRKDNFDAYINSMPNPSHAKPPTDESERDFRQSRAARPAAQPINEIKEEPIKQEQPQAVPESDRKRAENPFNIPKAKNFYQMVRGRLEEIMTINPKEPELERIIPDSEWVKVRYDGEDYYVVGRLYENNVVTYIGYGVPGVENIRPPKEAEELCDFLPLPNKHGAGYWLMFQKADDGTLSKDL
ncbi:MAG: hypothetical protein GX095_01245 [Clostridiales bacterium]|jgi:hypothetical protein|nr:hypothetical protein [Clostridiales bacterium]